MNLELLDESGRLHVNRLVKTMAARSPETAAIVARLLPSCVQPLSPPLQDLLFRSLQAAAVFDPEPLPSLLPFLAPTLRALPPESRGAMLEHVARVAQTFPAGVARLFRALVRAYEEVGEAGVTKWILVGEDLARRNPQAAEAFFALESRTSLLILRQASPAIMLSDIQGLLLKFLHMIGGAAVAITEADSLSFPPALSDNAGAVLPLPASVDIFPTYEDNLRLYRVFAAHQAGRVEFGTYDLDFALLWPHLPRPVHALLDSDQEPPRDLQAYFQLFPRPGHIEDLFILIESRRVAHRLGRSYRGLQEDLLWADSLTDLLPPSFSALLLQLPASAVRNDATAYDSLLLATEMYFAAPPSSATRPVGSHSEMQEEGGEEELMGEESTALEVEGGGGQDGRQLSATEQAELRKIMAALRAHQKQQGKKARRKKSGTVIFSTEIDSVESEELEEGQGKKKRPTSSRQQTTGGMRYFYDEWDYLIEDYRPHWCQLRELPLPGDNGAFFSRAIATYEEIAPDIKREFQRLRPKQYRHVRGLEDGEEIDLDAAVAARVDFLTGMAPSPKLYAARQPLERDVSALFLLDMSASTDMQIPQQEGKRVIDVLKESLVLLSAALEDIGDAYAIYGFSSGGRRDVEVYPVKSFAESLSADAKGRIGGIEPKRSTRMGAAVRHATRKLADLSSRAKLLVLLSDGYPEDMDYGRGQDAPTYGLRDTMMALREAERKGILSFCLTVDKSGHDYLREMCAPSRYMVIEDVLSLPLELPKIYQRHIRSQSV